MMIMKRREMMLATGVAALGLSAFPTGWVAAEEKKKQTILYFTRMPVSSIPWSIARATNSPIPKRFSRGSAEKHGFDVVCSQDPKIFEGDLDPYDAIAFYTTGKRNFGGGQSEAARSDPRRKGVRGRPLRHRHLPHPGSATAIDPYTAMIGAEFLIHASQQKARLKVVSPKFPGMKGLGGGFEMNEEWYAFRKYAPDLHVILVQETAGMHDDPYQRPPYPATWARIHGKGRVFYTSMGHRKDVWTNPKFQQVLLGGIAWALGNVQADITPNIAQVAPGAYKLKN